MDNVGFFVCTCWIIMAIAFILLWRVASRITARLLEDFFQLLRGT